MCILDKNPCSKECNSSYHSPIIRLKISRRGEEGNNVSTQLLGIHIRRVNEVLELLAAPINKTSTPNISISDINDRTNQAIIKYMEYRNKGEVDAMLEINENIESAETAEEKSKLLELKNNFQSLTKLVRHLHFIIEVDTDDRKKLEKLLNTKKYKKYLNVRFNNNNRREYLKKLKLALNNAGFTLTLLDEPMSKTRNETSKENIKPKLTKPTLFDFSQAPSLLAAREQAKQEKAAELAEKQAKQEKAEEQARRPAEEQAKQAEAIKKTVMEYLNTLFQRLKHAKSGYTNYLYAFDEGNKFLDKIEILIKKTDSLLSKEENIETDISSLKQEFFEFDLSITAREIELLSAVIAFMQNKFHAPTEPHLFADLEKKINNIKDRFHSFCNIPIDANATALYQKYVAEISALDDEIQTNFLDCKAIMDEYINQVISAKETINDQYESLDDSVKCNINLGDYITRLEELAKDVVSEGICFAQVNDEREKIVREFSDEKQKVIDNQNLITSIREKLPELEKNSYAIEHKIKNIRHDFSARFFKTLSKKKQAGLKEILHAQAKVDSILHKVQPTTNLVFENPEELRLALIDLNSSIDKNMETLSQYRGFKTLTKIFNYFGLFGAKINGSTHSDQLADQLKDSALALRLVLLTAN